MVFGLTLSAHGAQKLFGWFGGDSLTSTGGFFELLGFRPGRVFAAIAVLTEIVAGLLITFGLLGSVGPALMLSVMIVAAGGGSARPHAEADADDRCSRTHIQRGTPAGGGDL